MRAAPAVSCARGRVEDGTQAYRAAENIRHSLRNGFTAYNALTPEYRALLASVASRNLARRPGWAFAPPEDLMPTTEASGPHVFAVRFDTAHRHALKIAHGFNPAPQSHRAHDAVASTATPVPTFGDDGQRPFLRGQDGDIYTGDLHFG